MLLRDMSEQQTRRIVVTDSGATFTSRNNALKMTTGRTLFEAGDN